MKFHSILGFLFIVILKVLIFLILLFLNFRLAKSITKFIPKSHFTLLRLNLKITLLWGNKGRTMMGKAFLFLDPIENIKLWYNATFFFLDLIGLYIKKIIGYLALALGMLIENGGFRGLAVLEEGRVLVLAALARSRLVKEKTHYNILTPSSQVFT